MQLKISFLIFILIFLLGCNINTNKEIVKTKIEKKDKITENEHEDKIAIDEPEDKIAVNSNKKLNTNTPFYFIGEPYFIEGVKYIPKEDYQYSATGLASFYSADLHKKRTVNNEYNNVTELLARHKTLPLPSIVKITNLENGLSIIVKVNDRGPNHNSRIIEVSRKVAQLLRFYKNKIARVNVELLVDPSKQMKTVTESMNDPDFNLTMQAAPTEPVTVTNLEENVSVDNSEQNNRYEQPIELGFEIVMETNLFVKVTDLNSYEDTQTLKDVIQNTYKTTIQKDNEKYTVLFGPLINQEADNLFQILVSKGYKQLEIIIN